MSPDPMPNHRVGPALTTALHRNTLDVLLRRASAEHPREKLTFWSDDGVVQHDLASLDVAASTLADGFWHLGLRPGDGVAVQLPNRFETAIIYRAAFYAGLVITPIVHIYGPTETGFILRQSAARIFFCLDRWRGRDYLAALPALGDCPDLRHVVVVGETAPGTIDFATLLATSHPPAPRPQLTSSDVALLLYTSGTTAEPKGVVHTHGSLLGETDQRLARDAGFGSNALSPWPAGHIGGFASLLTPQVIGGNSVFMDRWVPAEAVKLIERFGTRFMAGVPVMLDELLDAAAVAKTDLSSLRDYMTGAANVPPTLVRRAELVGLKVYRAYGSSEHPTVTSGAPDLPLERRANTDGIVGAGAELRLVDDAGNDVAAEAAGEIVTRGVELFRGYKDEALNADAFLPGGWFRTGDIGRLEGDYLIITDRKKDIIIRGGENISSKEVEDALASHHAIAEVAVIPTRHERLGETVFAVVRRRGGETLTLAEARDHVLAKGMARQKCPERIAFVDDFPRTAAGKIRKVELRERFDS